MYSEIQNTTIKRDYYIQQNCLLKLKEILKTSHVTNNLKKFMTTKVSSVEENGRNILVSRSVK